MRPDGHENIQIARRPAAQACLALAGDADARPVLDPGRHIHRQGLFLVHASGTAADAARVVDHPARAMTCRTCAFDREKALLCPHLARTLTGRTANRVCTTGGT